MRNKFVDIKEDPILSFSDIICLSETWLTDHEQEVSLELNGFKLHTVSVGHGKGLATYYREDKLSHCKDVKLNEMQLTKFSSEFVDVISVYRSKDGNLKLLANHILNMTTPNKATVVCGDVNVCLRKNKENMLNSNLTSCGYSQLVKEATHIRGGMIDHVYYKQIGSELAVDVTLYSPYYTAFDHDALLITLGEDSEENDKENKIR